MNPDECPRAYEYYGKPLTIAGFNLIDEVGILGSLSSGFQLSRDECMQLLIDKTGDMVLAERYLGSTLDYLYIQGILDFNGGRYSLTSSGGDLLYNKKNLKELVGTYGPLSALSAYESFGEGEVMTLRDCNVDVGQIVGNEFLQDVLVVPAIAILREVRLELEELNLTQALVQRGRFDMQDIERRGEPANLHFLLDALKAKGLITGSGGRVIATKAGMEVFKNPGYAQYILSYYATYGALPELGIGQVIYDQVKWDQPGFVGRHPGHNAKGSGDILGYRVLPFIETLFREDGALYDYALESGFDGLTLVSFGPGDGKVCRSTVGDTDGCVQRSVGVELSVGAIAHATALDASAGLSSNIGYIHGSMINEDDVRRLGEMAQSSSLGIVGETSFIPHDIGLANTGEFLHLYRKYFPGSPIIINESFEVPIEVMHKCRSHQPPSFWYSHKVSGQQLAPSQVWRDLFRECGFREMVAANGDLVGRVHSSIADRTIPTIKTMVLEPISGFTS
ncbi:MAG: hypothetical protein Q8P68_05735 [Candidatus Peregrinibacteria bacterium]|nr:hypothetical protein [Candidatus Peregrinibacteria bacterium]MDZ4244991.1 hypothetical protein [Candidatus Gracilibacteria bacterium]